MNIPGQNLPWRGLERLEKLGKRYPTVETETAHPYLFLDCLSHRAVIIKSARAEHYHTD